MIDYQQFLNTKQDFGALDGFEPLWMPDFLFDFQRALVEWSVRKGRAAFFADCGLGKTPMQLVWAENIVRKTNKPVLILTPLAVAAQTIAEADKFGIEAYRPTPVVVHTGINVLNYEQLEHYDATQFAGVVCDESSILKSFDGQRKAAITEFMRRVPYRLLCTATAAPNDYIELGTSSEALGYMGYMDMLTRFFTNKESHAYKRWGGGRDDYRLKGHAQESFWRWVCSWARACRKPSDLGFENDGFILTKLHENQTLIKATRPREGLLFDLEATNFHEERELTRRTIVERCEAVAAKVASHKVSLVWCHLNDEGDLLEKLIPDSIQVSGDDTNESKEAAIQWFTNGKGRRTLISKPRIFGWGLNLQHCNHVTYFPTHSYEQYYQAVRRCWRFGQKRPVTVDIVGTDGDKRVMDNLRRKSLAADKMFVDLVMHMHDALHISPPAHNGQPIGVPSWL
jgi:hypothetical protein